MNKNPAPMRKEIDTSIVDRDTQHITAVIDAAAVASVNGQKWVNFVRDRASSDDEIERWTSVS